MKDCPQDIISQETKMQEFSSNINDKDGSYEASDKNNASRAFEECNDQGITQNEIQNEEESEIKIGKLFVGGLPFTSNDNALYDYFIQFGDIKEAVVIRDRLTGASKGYGFVTMKDHQSATEALKNPNPYIDGRRCNINYAFKNTKKREKVYQEGLSRYRHQYVPQQQPIWSFGFDPYSLYDYRQQAFNFMNYPCSVDNQGLNIYPGYETRPEIPFQQIYSQFIPLSFTTPSGSHLAAFYHPYANNTAIYEIPSDKKLQTQNPDQLVDDLKNINITQTSEMNAISIDHTLNTERRDESNQLTDNTQKISSISKEENINTSHSKNNTEKEEQWQNRKYMKNIKISENDGEKNNHQTRS